MQPVIKCEDLPETGINPKVLDCYLYKQGLNYPKGHRLPPRYIYDYELEFFTQSEGAMVIDGKLYPIAEGDLAFRRPGQTTQAIMPYCCYLICFDLTGTTAKEPRNYNFCTDQHNEYQNDYRNPKLESIPSVFHPFSGDKYRGLFDQVLNEFINPSDASSLILKAYMLQILYNLIRDVRDPLNNEAVLRTPHGRIVKKTVDYIRENINEPLRLELLAKQAGASPNYFHKIFRETTGIPLNEYVIQTRLERAKELLVRSEKPIYQIAVECGFANIPYFTTLFKKRHGITPQEFRKRYNYISVEHENTGVIVR